MILSKIFSNEIHPLKLKNSLKFKEEWQKCLGTNLDMSVALEMLKPYLAHWKELLTKREYPRNVEYAALYLQLKEPSISIRKWIKSIDSIEAELIYIACAIIRESSYFPTRARPAKAEYVFAFLFRKKLQRSIQKVSTPKPELDDTYEEPILDYFAIESESHWEQYLKYYILNGYNLSEIAEMIHIPRETIYYEEQQIWYKLKSKYLPANQ